MKKHLRIIQIVLALAFLSALLILQLFNKETGSDERTFVNNQVTVAPPVVEDIQIPEPEIENKSYLFDVSMHTIEELEALLTRAEEVSQTHPKDFEDLEIVMIIHGPDIEWFTHKNYEYNQKLVDLAARLDAYDVIDMKVCERTMQKRGVVPEDIPDFIESVPYAPTEIDRLLNDGYINL